ncbi:hypothetical protein BJ875DRAFT_514496 [Amylocarpus encephaloides]|uniref:Uncharacterized protein n=1 Tax=Amylocarpus encephaloides TaxID=45428 RepID=A0A9P8C3T1_9HELO|nr:hypothetical protein BJ875DRAFT_514496 [Amylocarpus encephaloides]
MNEAIKIGLDEFCIELQEMILERIPDMTSLWSFIRTSKNMYAIFHSSKDKILRIVITREISPGVMKDALAAYSSTKFNSCREVTSVDAAIPSNQPSHMSVVDWLATYYIPSCDLSKVAKFYVSEKSREEWIEGSLTRKKTVRNISLSSEEMLLLWELHKDVKFIADLYVQETLPIFNHCFTYWHPRPALERTPTLQDLSLIEKQRIFRAIYHFVIFGNLFCPVSTLGTLIWGHDRIALHYLCLFPAWQVEEISCVYDFIVNKVNQKWQEMEDYVFNSLAADPSKWGIETRSDINAYWRPIDFSSSSKDVYAMSMLDLLTLVPIRSLRVLIQAKEEILKDLVLDWHAFKRNWGGRILDMALLVDPGHLLVAPGGRSGDWGDDEPYFEWKNGDSLMASNVGWNWANNWHPRELYAHSTSDGFYSTKLEAEDNEGFRRIGYVFWDAWRWSVGCTVHG